LGGLKMGIRRLLDKAFGRYFITGYYDQYTSTKMIVARGWFDMELTLFFLRLKCAWVEVI
jgi:hypothetical protein